MGLRNWQFTFNHILYVDDESRVHLGLLTGVEGSDYINANYIDVSFNSSA